MSATSVQLLQAASEIVGGKRALARELGIGEMLLDKFLDDRRELPDTLLLRAVDIILADRQAQRPSRSASLSPAAEIVDNRSRGNGGAATGGGTE